MTQGKIVKISGPLVVAEGMFEADMFDVVRVGEQNLIGEIIEMRNGMASIQVYEETAGVKFGDEVVTTGGIIGIVIRVTEDTVLIETGNDRTHLRVLRSSIAENRTVHDNVETLTISKNK